MPIVTLKSTSRVLSLLFSLFVVTRIRADEVVSSESTAVHDGESGTGAYPFFKFRLPLEYGPFTLRPHFDYKFVHASGVQSQPGSEQTTTIQTIAPGFLVDVGENWQVDYTPTWNYYSQEAFDDNVSHSVSVSGKTSHDDWSAKIVHRFRRVSTPLVETGRQTTQRTNGTQVRVARDLFTRWSVDVGAERNTRDAKGFSDVRDRGADTWLNYQVTTWLRSAAGFAYSLSETDGGPDTEATRYRLRMSARTSEKIGFQVHGGIENRKYKTETNNRLRTPVYGAAFVYRILETTTLTATGDRGVTASFFRNQESINQRWRVSLQQRLLQRFFLTLETGRRMSKYSSTIDESVTRKDTGTTHRISLRTHFRERGTISVFYSRARNESGQSRFEFESNQTGLDFSYRF